MRRQIIDPTLNFECGSCGSCCSQPWDVVIEPDKAAVVDSVDWAADWPEMAGASLYRSVKRGNGKTLVLAKRADFRCVFLDADNLCRIHKKLGPEAKPVMCGQFPLIPSRAADADYVSVNYGCPAVQAGSGARLCDQAEMVQRCAPVSKRPVEPEKPVALTLDRSLARDDATRLMSELRRFFDASRPGSITARFVQTLATLRRVVEMPDDELTRALANGTLTDDLDIPALEPFESAAAAPMPSRFLFAITLFKDTLPVEQAHERGMSFLRRLTLIPKLISLTTLRGGYASRLLKRNVRFDEVVSCAADSQLDDAGTALLCRYITSRIWQQNPAGTQLPIMAGMHQHILDIGAVVMYARALAGAERRHTLDLAAVKQALHLVEFNLACQERIYAHVLKDWLRSALDAPPVAWSSLRMIRCPAPLRVVGK